MWADHKRTRGLLEVMDSIWSCIWLGLNNSNIIALHIYKRWILWYINYASKYLIKSKRTKAYQNSAVLLSVSSSNYSFIHLPLPALTFDPHPTPSLELIASCLAPAPQTEGNVSSTAPKWLQRPVSLVTLELYSLFCSIPFWRCSQMPRGVEFHLCPFDSGLLIFLRAPWSHGIQPICETQPLLAFHVLKPHLHKASISVEYILF